MLTPMPRDNNLIEQLARPQATSRQEENGLCNTPRFKPVYHHALWTAWSTGNISEIGRSNPVALSWVFVSTSRQYHFHYFLEDKLQNVQDVLHQGLWVAPHKGKLGFKKLWYLGYLGCLCVIYAKPWLPTQKCKSVHFLDWLGITTDLFHISWLAQLCQWILLHKGWPERGIWNPKCETAFELLKRAQVRIQC